MHENKQKTVLVSPMNWGLGHAARMVPVIRELLGQGQKVIIGAYGDSALLLKKEFEECTHVELRGFTPVYSSVYSQTFALIGQSLKFLFHKIREHRKTKEIVRNYNVDLIISDNRYGVWCKKIPSALVTHQLSPALGNRFKFLESFVSYIFSHWIKNFNECWIPDVPGKNNLSGKLSKNDFGLNVKYSGILSRFNKCMQNFDFEYEYLAVISGPEPWRSIFEKDLVRLFGNLSGRSVIVRGVPGGGNEEYNYNGIILIHHLETDALNMLMCNSRNIICRPGYTTLMDLFTIGRRALLVPTPGQPEQEYLADHMHESYGFTKIKQHDVLKTDVKSLLKYERNIVPLKNDLLEKLLHDFFK